MATQAGMYLQRRVNATPGPFRSAARSGVLADRVVGFPSVNGFAERAVYGNGRNSSEWSRECACGAGWPNLSFNRTPGYAAPVLRAPVAGRRLT